jgi:alanyl-tRNA synthetase
MMSVIGAIVKICGGGGGRPNLAQAGGREAAKLPKAVDTCWLSFRIYWGESEW